MQETTRDDTSEVPRDAGAPGKATIATLVARAHGHRGGNTTRLRRVVMRMSAEDVSRVDALRPRFKTPRAALLRAFLMVGLAVAEAPDEGATP